MVRSVTIGDREFTVNIGMAVFSQFLDKSNVTQDQLAKGEIKFLNKEVFDLFAMGVRDAARLNGKRKTITWQEIADLCDSHDDAFTKITEIVTDEIGSTANKMAGKTADSDAEPGKS